MHPNLWLVYTWNSTWITDILRGETNMCCLYFLSNKCRLQRYVNKLWNYTLELNDSLMRLWLLFHLHSIKDNWALSSNYFLSSMKLMKHEKSIREQHSWSNHKSFPYQHQQANVKPSFLLFTIARCLKLHEELSVPVH